MVLHGDTETIVKRRDVQIDGGKIKTIALKYEYTKTIDLLTQKGYKENDRKTISFSHKGYNFKNVPLYQVRNTLNGLTPEDRKHAQAAGVTHYIGTHLDIDGKRPFCIVEITESEYNAIMDYFKEVEMIESKPFEKFDAKKTYKDQIEDAQATGKKVLIYTKVEDSDNEESDTVIVKGYIDGNGKITETKELMD